MKIFLKILLSFIFVMCIIRGSLYAQDDEKLIEGIKKAYELFSSGDFSNIGDFIDDNFIDHSPMQGQKPGLAGVKEIFEMMHKAYPDMKFTINDIICKDNKAAVLFTFTGTNTGEMMGMKPTGKSISIMGIDYLYFKDGKATEHWGYMDTEAMMKQLGMMPEEHMKHDMDK